MRSGSRIPCCSLSGSAPHVRFGRCRPESVLRQCSAHRSVPLSPVQERRCQRRRKVSITVSLSARALFAAVMNATFISSSVRCGVEHFSPPYLWLHRQMTLRYWSVLCQTFVFCVRTVWLIQFNFHHPKIEGGCIKGFNCE